MARKTKAEAVAAAEAEAEAEQETWEAITEGDIVHVSAPGVTHCQPAIVVRAWGGYALNVQVFRDGTNDVEDASLGHHGTNAIRWATSVPHVSKVAIEGDQSWHAKEHAE